MTTAANMNVRLDVSLVHRIDAHAQRLCELTRLAVNRSDAVRALLVCALEIAERKDCVGAAPRLPVSAQIRSHDRANPAGPSIPAPCNPP